LKNKNQTYEQEKENMREGKNVSENWDSDDHGGGTGGIGDPRGGAGQGGGLKID
jgi:hypothetical protein